MDPPIAMTSGRTSSVAKRRWKILRCAVVEAAKAEAEKAKADEEEEISVRRFSSFQLFRVGHIDPPVLGTSDGENRPLKRKHISDRRDPTATERDGDGGDDVVSWLEYRLGEEKRKSLKICLRSPKISLRDLADFGNVDNTGNVCVWPAEEVLAFYLARRPGLVRGKVVVELGGGMTCLAGLVAAKWAGAKSVVMTDGNVKAVENVGRILEANDLVGGRHDGDRVPPRPADASTTTTTACNGASDPGASDDAQPVALCPDTTTTPPLPPPPFSTRLLRWDAVAAHASDLRHSVDVVIAADCLFFDAFRQSLVDSLVFLLADSADAVALIFAPRRDRTMDDFIRSAEESHLAVSMKEDYEDEVTARLIEARKTGGSSFDEDIHYPLLLEIKRAGRKH